MSDEPVLPIEPRKVLFPAPPVCTAAWEQKDWDAYIAQRGSPEPLVLHTQHIGEWHAVGRNANGELLYRRKEERDGIDGSAGA